jgi:AcrR family transcriptional regulator
MLTLSTLTCENSLVASYHHGNLRAALIDTGLKLIEEKGVRALTLREIGSLAGVSRSAAYRHFADKADLLAAISEAGFKEFGDALERARQSATSTFAARLDAMAVAYVRFASKHRAHYEVMFGDAAFQESEYAVRAFRILEETIRQGQEAGEIRLGDPVQLARMLWSLVHGISTLRLEPNPTKLTLFSAEVLRTGLYLKPSPPAARTRSNTKRA